MPELEINEVLIQILATLLILLIYEIYRDKMEEYKKKKSKPLRSNFQGRFFSNREKIEQTNEKESKDDTAWVDVTQFERWKKKISRNCNQTNCEEFLDFLKTYKGGYIRRNEGRIIFQGYLKKEKSDLKGIFYQVIVPAPSVMILTKEAIRSYLQLEIGVNGINEMPDYDAAMNDISRDISAGDDMASRKEVGNRGELMVRKELKKLSPKFYTMLQGVVLQYGEERVEYDHIIIGIQGVFVIETKAYGLSKKNDGRDKALLTIDEKDRWTLKKFNKDKREKSPTDQIHREIEVLSNIIDDESIRVNGIVVLANDALTVKKSGKRDYRICKKSALIANIYQYKDDIDYMKRRQLTDKILEHRVL